MALSRVVSDVFNVEKYCDLEIRVRGHSRSLKVVPFDRLHMFLRRIDEILDRDLETRVRGHSRSLTYRLILVNLTNFGDVSTLPMTSYSRFVLTMSLSRTVSEIGGDFSRKSQVFPCHSVYLRPC